MHQPVETDDDDLELLNLPQFIAIGFDEDGNETLVDVDIYDGTKGVIAAHLRRLADEIDGLKGVRH